jgi:replicative DNA helicase
VFKLVTRTGREVRATANHPFRALEGWRPLEELRRGDRIAVPRRYPPLKTTPTWSNDQLVLLGHLVGDGCYAPRQPLHYTSASEANLCAVEGAALSAFGVSGRRVRQGSWQHLYLSAGASKWHPNPITAWLRDLGIYGQRSGNKVLPQGIFSQTDEQIALLLRHLWATDGCNLLRRVTQRFTGAIYYSTNSEVLAHQVQHLLSRLEIRSRIGRVSKAGYAANYHANISGLDDQARFVSTVGAHGDRLVQLQPIVERLAATRANTNLDTIPREVWGSVRALMQDRGISQRRMTMLRGTAYGGTSHFQFAPSRAQLGSYASILESAELSELASSDVFWDEVVSIEADGVEDVYDMTVPGTHNFVANGIVVHNSIEQDADVVLFIYRDEKYNPDTDKKGVADIIVAKHRNGPTGQVQLLFLERTTKFLDLEVFRA